MSEGFFVCGFHAVMSAIRGSSTSVKQIYLERSRDDPRARDLDALAQARAIRVVRVDRARLDGMTAGARHQGVAARVESGTAGLELDDVLDSPGEHVVLALDQVQDPRNLGACIRVADGFGVKAVIAPKDRAVGLTPSASKASAGAIVPFFAVTNLARELTKLSERDFKIVGAAHDAEDDIRSADLAGSVAWVLGAEAKGLRRLTRERCDTLVRIPMAGSVASLNLAVACGICLYETWRQRTGFKA
ncbi:MAG: 23S rRNA (guanosine(2251)-2'-O)-methyltransferase RlmB [Burkholderiales bacterium]